VIVTEEQRVRYAIEGWPRPVGEDRCTCTTLEGEQCRKRRAQGKTTCQQHERKAKP
jgi:hypothetical protein